MKNRSNDDYSASSSTTGGIGGIDYGAPAGNNNNIIFLKKKFNFIDFFKKDGKFRCNFEGCGKEYDFQSE